MIHAHADSVQEPTSSAPYLVVGWGSLLFPPRLSFFTSWCLSTLACQRSGSRFALTSLMIAKYLSLFSVVLVIMECLSQLSPLVWLAKFPRCTVGSWHLGSLDGRDV